MSITPKTIDLFEQFFKDYQQVRWGGRPGMPAYYAIAYKRDLQRQFMANAMCGRYPNLAELHEKAEFYRQFAREYHEQRNALAVPSHQ